MFLVAGYDGGLTYNNFPAQAIVFGGELLISSSSVSSASPASSSSISPPSSSSLPSSSVSAIPPSSSVSVGCCNWVHTDASIDYVSDLSCIFGAVNPLPVTCDLTGKPECGDGIGCMYDLAGCAEAPSGAYWPYYNLAVGGDNCPASSSSVSSSLSPSSSVSLSSSSLSQSSYPSLHCCTYQWVDLSQDFWTPDDCALMATAT